MGTMYLGGQGTGKTTALARHLVEYMHKYPERAIFVLDWSGSITDSLLSLIMAVKDRESLLKRVIYDQLGHDEYVIPMPEFSTAYGGTYEDQIQRVIENFRKLSPALTTNAPLLGGLAISEIAPHFLRLVTSATNDAVDPNETWQITEAKRLMVDQNLLKRMLTKYGSKIPETTWYLTREYLSSDIKASERELRTYALRAILNITDIREVKARLGYYHPGWTPKEAIQTGKLVIVDGGKLINQESGEEEEKEVTQKDFIVFGKYYLPEETIQLAGNDHYIKWVKEGYITETPGARTDFLYIENDLKIINKDHSIIELAFDPREASYLINNVSGWLGSHTVDGEEVSRCVEITQGPQLMSEPMKETEGRIYSQTLWHNGDPVMTWMMGNVVKKQGRNSGPVKYYYPTKEKNEFKIDGPVAMIMSVSRAMKHVETGSVYDNLSKEDMRKRLRGEL